jgi:hypothetical protein
MHETFKRHDFDSNKTTDHGNLSKPFLAFVAKKAKTNREPQEPLPSPPSM